MEHVIVSFLSSVVSAVLTSKAVLLYLAYAAVMSFLLWFCWATLNVAYARRQRLWGKLYLIHVGPLGLIIDVLHQVTVAPLIFLDLPRETTLSMRLTRYLSGRTADKLGTKNYGYRVPLAVWLATNLIEPWGKGHIGLERFGYPASLDYLTKAVKRT